MKELYARDDMKTEYPSEIKVIKWTLLKGGIVSFFKDFDRYIDFSIAKFLVWRELRYRRKEAKSADRENRTC